MESSRPNGSQHHVRGNKSALFFTATKYELLYLLSRRAEDEGMTSFSVFRRHASCQIVTWSTACSPFLQMQAKAWLASVPGESMREPERGHLCCTDQKETWTPGSGKTVSIFPASKGHEWVWIFCQKSKLNPEIISSPTSQYFFLHSSITLSLQWPLHLGLCAHSFFFPARLCFFNNPPLAQTSTHQVSSNLAARPWSLWQRHISPFSFDTAHWL